MYWIESPIDQLPDEVLAAILKLGADSPISEAARELRALPTSITASRVSHRWRAVTVNSPELWDTIRLSHRSRSWSWARMFVKRSRSYPLDISINLEVYGNSYGGGDISLAKALDIVGPHIVRWRTFALRCAEHELQQFSRFLEQSQDACRLQSASISLLGDYYWPETTLPPLALIPLVRGASFYSLRVNFPLETAVFTAFRAVRSLDIDVGRHYPYLNAFRLILGPSSPLETLIIRIFPPKSCQQAYRSIALQRGIAHRHQYRAAMPTSTTIG
ncbi:hypothetical protein DFH06DRAFT_1203333 [Mycena polygramma]|nr:hypothetical protein DFH06DRAFT_1203333 [Mycena polygramma]